MRLRVIIKFIKSYWKMFLSGCLWISHTILWVISSRFMLEYFRVKDLPIYGLFIMLISGLILAATLIMSKHLFSKREERSPE